MKNTAINIIEAIINYLNTDDNSKDVHEVKEYIRKRCRTEGGQLIPRRVLAMAVTRAIEHGALFYKGDQLAVNEEKAVGFGRNGYKVVYL